MSNCKLGVLIYLVIRRVNDTGAKDGILDMIINVSSLGWISTLSLLFKCEGQVRGKLKIGFIIISVYVAVQMVQRLRIPQ